MMGVTATRQDKMKFLYDAPCVNNCIERAPIFLHDPATSDVRKITSGGKYYKNVRHEYASMVMTPTSARFRFSDSLAFTRSLGDFHLHAYGLTFEPDIMEVDLATAFHRHLGQKYIHENDDSTSSPSVSSETVLVLASDGVWDVWQYHDVACFFLAEKHITATANTMTATTAVAAAIEEEPEEHNAQDDDHDDNHASRSGHKAAERVRQFMDANLRKAHELFGEQADNMTLIACFVNATAAS
jgi:serine/threonine protein phosphatase PrpC